MLRKLIVVYNPRSSHHQAIEREVLAPARHLQGWLVGKYEVKAAGLDENARDLAKLLNDGDLVIVAGGDGTAAMAANGVMLSEKDVTIGVMGYGNFDDMARMLKTKRPVEYGGEYVGGVSEIIERFEAGKVTEIYPLEAKVDGKHWRYAPCYLTLGLLAESTAVFDEEKVRDKLKTGKKGLGFSVWQLVKWYFRHHNKQEFLPEGELQQKLVKEQKSGEAKVAPMGEKAEKAEKIEKEQEEEEKVKAKRQTHVEAAEMTVLLKKERAEKRVARKQERQRQLKKAKKAVKKLFRRVRKWWEKVLRKVKSGVVELKGRSKARVSDLKVQTEVKVAKTRQKRQEKHEREMANRPEIIIDTEVTRAEKQKEKADEDED